MLRSEDALHNKRNNGCRRRRPNSLAKRGHFAEHGEHGHKIIQQNRTPVQVITFRILSVLLHLRQNNRKERSAYYC